MQELVRKIRGLENSGINKLVDSRLAEFSSFASRPAEDWFEELCFCILAANSKGRLAYNIQLELRAKGFMTKPEEEIVKTIQRHKHRFHNNKARYIISSREYWNIKENVTSLLKSSGVASTRAWLVQNIKGIGMKEASHLLRNTGTFDIAILDRHILNTMTEHGIIEMPKTMTRQNYLRLEKTFLDLARTLDLLPAKLDLFLWYMKAGEVLK